MTTGLQHPTPWGPIQRTQVVALNLVGGVLLVWAFVGSSTTADLASQVIWVDLAIGGTVVAAAGDALWLLAGRRAVLGRRRDLLGHVGESTATSPPGQRAPDDGWVHVPGTRRAHRPRCLLVQGKEAVAVDPATSTRDSFDLQRCEVCW